MSNSWKAQRQRVQALATTVRERQLFEAQQRHELKAWTKAKFAQVESMFWVGVTGAIWMNRRKKIDKDDRHNPLLEIAIAAWVMHRYKRIPERIGDAIEEARGGAAGDGELPTRSPDPVNLARPSDVS